MKKIFIALLLVVFAITTNAQENSQEFKFETIADLDATPIKSQGKTGTCWSFSTIFVFRIRNS